jgi:methionyl aminopeptidase
VTAGSQKDIDKLTKIGKIVATTIQEMREQTVVGMTTQELDEIGGSILARYGAVSAPKEIKFPGYTCISINRNVAHGIPGAYVIQPGDLVNIDVSAKLDGYYADSGYSFQMAPVETKITRLCNYTHQTMMKVIQSLKAGVRINQIGRIMETEAKLGGYKVIRNLCSHGIGKSLHEEPREILPYYNPMDKSVLKNGQVITIEPFLSTGADYVEHQADGWTLRVPDHSYVAQFEHTLIITRDKPIIVTAL